MTWTIMISFQLLRTEGYFSFFCSFLCRSGVPFTHLIHRGDICVQPQRLGKALASFIVLVSLCRWQRSVSRYIFGISVSVCPMFIFWSFSEYWRWHPWWSFSETEEQKKLRHFDLKSSSNVVLYILRG